MHYKTKSTLTVIFLIAIMVVVGVLVNFFQGGITGAMISGDACHDNAGCDDGITCTIDSCKNPGTGNSFCSNVAIESCQDNDGCCPAGCTETNDKDC